MSSDWPFEPDDDFGDDDLREADVRELESLLAELEPADLEFAPVPDDVWAGIEEQLLADEPAEASVVAFRSRRRRGAWVILAAAAVILLAVPIVIVATGGGSDTEVLSAAALTYDPTAFDPRGADARAVAELVERDGRYEIRLVDAQLPAIDGEDLELWLIEPDDAGQPVDVASVARIGDDGTYAVPAGLDPISHFVVDISIEPRDGDAAHSGKSILRGALQTG